MLGPGDFAEDFTLPDQTGTPQTLSVLLADGPVVLFFYPRAMTHGCTKESCHFRDLAAEFSAVGAQRMGISADPVERQAAFDTANDLGYPLLSDSSKSVAASFGVTRTLLPFSKRSTFVIDKDRRILAAISSETNFDVHADEALDVLRRAAG